MKKFIFILCAGLSFYARLDGCQKCFDSMRVQHKYIGSIMDESREEVGISFSDEAFRCMKLGFQRGFENAMKTINGYHSETNISFFEWQKIMDEKDWKRDCD